LLAGDDRDQVFRRFVLPWPSSHDPMSGRTVAIAHVENSETSRLHQINRHGSWSERRRLAIRADDHLPAQQVMCDYQVHEESACIRPMAASQGD
jgi:hypothetical protein